MILVGLFQWWYSLGIVAFTARLKRMLLSTLDFFSVGILLKTLFNPFRQIVGVSANGSLAMQFRAFVDTVISRFIGMLIRLATLAIGLIAIFIQLIISALAIIVWALMPIIPLASLVMLFTNGAFVG